MCFRFMGWSIFALRRKSAPVTKVQVQVFCTAAEHTFNSVDTPVGAGSGWTELSFHKRVENGARNLLILPRGGVGVDEPSRKT